METRNTTAVSADFQLRNTDGPNPGTVVGYAAVFDKLSHDLGGFREKISNFAFTDAAMGGDIVALLNHNSDLVLGRARSGTLRVAPDTAGLHFELDLSTSSYAKDAWLALLRNDLTGASFGFTIASDEWSQDLAGNPVRTINEIKQLFEVSLTAMPAYPDTKAAIASMRSYQQEGDTLRRHVEAESRVRAMRLCGA
jgi:HK97 family phage prohead protease